MRLIDADVMINNLTAMKSQYDAIDLDGMIRGLKEQSTAYDVEKVVEEIEKESVVSEGYFMNFTEEAVDIVKRGGIE